MSALALLLADPNVIGGIVGLGSLALGYWIRHKQGNAPAVTPAPVVTPPPVVPSAPSLLDALTPELTAVLQYLLQKQTHAAGTSQLLDLLKHVPPAVPPVVLAPAK